MTGKPFADHDTNLHDFILGRVNTNILGQIDRSQVGAFKIDHTSVSQLNTAAHSQFIACGYPGQVGNIDYDAKQIVAAPVTFTLTYAGLDTHKLHIFTHARGDISPEGMSGAPIFEISESDSVGARVKYAGMITLGGDGIFRSICPTVILGCLDNYYKVRA